MWADSAGEWCAAELVYVSGDRFDVELVAIVSSTPVCAAVATELGGR